MIIKSWLSPEENKRLNEKENPDISKRIKENLSNIDPND